MLGQGLDLQPLGGGQLVVGRLVDGQLFALLHQQSLVFGGQVHQVLPGGKADGAGLVVFVYRGGEGLVGALAGGEGAVGVVQLVGQGLGLLGGFAGGGGQAVQCGREVIGGPRVLFSGGGVVTAFLVLAGIREVLAHLLPVVVVLDAALVVGIGVHFFRGQLEAEGVGHPLRHAGGPVKDGLAHTGQAAEKARADP